MSFMFFTAHGCLRCRITREYLSENKIDYEEYDIKSNGKEVFAAFYRANRENIFRDRQGVEFPIIFDGTMILQGVSVIIARLSAKGRLDGFVTRSRMHGEWVDGITISSGSKEDASELYRMLFFLKKHGLKIQVYTDGQHPDILENIFENSLADKVVMEIKKPSENREQAAYLSRSLSCAARFPQYLFFTKIKPVIRKNKGVGFITPEEVREIAAMIEQATGSKKHPYVLKKWDVEKETNKTFKSFEPLEQGDLYKYRTMARRYMVMTEIEH